MGAMKKRIYFTRSYRKYFPGDYVTCGEAEADSYVRRGFAKPAPLEQDASGADDEGNEGNAPEANTGAPSDPDKECCGEEDCDCTLEALREAAKEAEIPNYWLMKEETLLEKLHGADEEE